MADGARVDDIEALKEFDVYLARFREDLIGMCDSLSIEFQRVQSWLHEEAFAYWKNELRRSENRLHEARQALMVCQNKSRAEDYEACSEQLKQFEKAKARLRLCEERLKRLKASQLEWEQFSNQAKPRIAEAADLADSSIPRAKFELSQILALLEKYRAT
jgi:histidyl-tRNA synthetase